MNKSLILVTIVAVAIVAGCIEKIDPPAASSTTVKAPTGMKKVPISQEIPAGIKGFGFEKGGKCAVDSVNKPDKGQVSTVIRTEKMSIDGWAFDDGSNTVPVTIALQLANASNQFYYSSLTRHGGRPDLVSGFGQAVFESAGYSATIDITTLPVGIYDMLIIQKGERVNFVCPTHRKLEVKG